MCHNHPEFLEMKVKPEIIGFYGEARKKFYNVYLVSKAKCVHIHLFRQNSTDESTVKSTCGSAWVAHLVKQLTSAKVMIP